MALLSWEEMQARAIKFSSAWKEAKKEEAEAQPFTLDFIRIFGIADPLAVGEFEVKVPLEGERTGYIDYFWPQKIAIEMKSPGKDLKKAYEQLKEYVVHLPPEQMPDVLMACDFANFHVYHRTCAKKTVFKLKDLRRHLREFSQLAGYEISRIPEEQLEVNVQAAEKMATLHDALLEYGYAGHPLEIYLVRLLFCLFADDTGIFPKGAFLDYVENSQKDGSDLAGRLAKLFEVLDMPPEERKKHRLLTPTLLQFQYINGKLFSEILPQADFDKKMRELLIQCAEFDWSRISPAIFGSIFQGVMDRKKRRALGAHYTSEENILRLINPLFMDDLWAEFEKITASPAKLDEFHTRIASLKFLDPACGCGNFLIITYRELRRLELAILKMKIETAQQHLDLGLLLKVRVSQFFGIEQEEFPAQIAQVGMWLMDHQMNMEAAETFGSYYIRLPLKQSAVIENTNSLKTDWLEVVPGEELSYILGNPPFVGSRMMTRAQKEEVRTIFSKNPLAGELDYVTCWFKKADEIMQKFPQVKTAFVATNSIIQGLQASLLWKDILGRGGEIDFAWRTFKWQNEARGKAAVHCVIIGFNRQKTARKVIFDGEKQIQAQNINSYLQNAGNIFIEPHAKPLSPVPQLRFGNMPRDGGNFVLFAGEREEILEKEPGLEDVIRLYLGAEEFLHGKERWCLWLYGVSPARIAKSTILKEKIELVRKFRLASKAKATRDLAKSPAVFAQIAQPDTDFLVIPRVTSENREYLPIGFEKPSTICSDLLFLLPEATLYHFGVLTSSAHNAWMRAVAGRLKSDYRYSKDIVYNNFPWPERDEKKEERIKRLAGEILDTRASFAGSSLADLYGPLTMPQDLLKAHKKLDKEVLKLYGISPAAGEEEIVMKLFERYQNMVGERDT